MNFPSIIFKKMSAAALIDTNAPYGQTPSPAGTVRDKPH